MPNSFIQSYKSYAEEIIGSLNAQLKILSNKPGAKKENTARAAEAAIVAKTVAPARNAAKGPEIANKKPARSTKLAIDIIESTEASTANFLSCSSNVNELSV